MGKDCRSGAWWCVPFIPAGRSLPGLQSESRASQGSVVGPSLKKKGDGGWNLIIKGLIYYTLSV